MSTNHVKRGANRGAHAAKTARAAQRTPLPPRGAIKAPAARAQEREVAQERLDEVRPVGTKAVLFAAECREAGWETTETAEDDVVTVKAVRPTPSGNEEIVVTWIKGKVLESALPTYTRAGQTKTLRNVARVRRVLNGSEPVVLSSAPRRSPTPRTVNTVTATEPSAGIPTPPMKRMRLQARDERKGIKKERRMCPVNVEGLGEQQVRSLTRIFEEDGYTVTTVVA